MMPLLNHIILYYSPKDASEGPFNSSSQYFHLDREETSQVKIYLFITDVNKDSGPLTVVKSSSTEKVKNEININPLGRRYEDHVINPQTQGADGSFTAEKYSFLVLNKNVVDVGVGQGENLNFNVGAVYNEESGRTSKKVIGQVASIRTGEGTPGTSRETSIIITGQMSGAIYVLPVKVNYIDNTPTE